MQRLPSRKMAIHGAMSFGDWIEIATHHNISFLMSECHYGFSSSNDEKLTSIGIDYRLVSMPRCVQKMYRYDVCAVQPMLKRAYECKNPDELAYYHADDLPCDISEVDACSPGESSVGSDHNKCWCYSFQIIDVQKSYKNMLTMAVVKETSRVSALNYDDDDVNEYDTQEVNSISVPPPRPYTGHWHWSQSLFYVFKRVFCMQP